MGVPNQRGGGKQLMKLNEKICTHQGESGGGRVAGGEWRGGGGGEAKVVDC